MKKTWYNNKTIIITGASSGFGKLLSQKLVKNHGCKVIGIARTKSKLEALKEELGEDFSFHAFDVSNKENWQALAKTLEKNNIKVDILINNAGMLPPFKKFELCTVEEIENTLSTNFFASVYSINALLPILKKSPSESIINISSSAALCTVRGSGAYSASKSALKSLTESLALEDNSRYVCLVCPGFAKTDIFRSQKNLDEKESSLISRVCSNPEKIVDKLLKKISKKKKRVVLGFDARLMDFFARIMPRLTPLLISKILKKSNISLFENI